MGFSKKDWWKQNVPNTGKVEHSESSNGAIKTSTGTVDNNTESRSRRWGFRSVLMKPFRRRRKSKSQKRKTKEGQHPNENRTEEKSESQNSGQPVTPQQASLVFFSLPRTQLPSASYLCEVLMVNQL